MRSEYPKYNTNRHGHSFGDDIFWIDDDQVEALLKGDGYTKIGGGISGGRSINGSPQKGDIIVYYNNGKVVHSGVYIGNGRISENLSYCMWGDYLGSVWLDLFLLAHFFMVVYMI